jgi:carbon storage regulator
MLVLTRKVGERIVIGRDIVLTISAIRGGNVKVGIDCPDDISIYREEVYRRIFQDGWVKENATPSEAENRGAKPSKRCMALA